MGIVAASRVQAASSRLAAFLAGEPRSRSVKDFYPERTVVTADLSLRPGVVSRRRMICLIPMSG
jgi:hypothetical protein